MALRDIIAKFGFDYDKAGLQQVNAGVENTKGAITGLVGTLGGLFALHKLKEFFGEIADEAANMGKVAAQTGNSIEQVEFLMYAIPGGADVASQAIRKFTIAMGKSEDGAQAQSEVFAKLGVNLKDASGEQISSGDALEQVAANWNKLPSAGAKAAAAVQLFGKAGISMVPLLNKGSEGLAKLHEEFDDLGGGFGEEAVENAMKYKKGLKQLNLALDSLKGSVAGPIFQWLADGYKTVAKGVGWFKRFTESTNITKAAVITLGVAGAAGILALLAPFAPVIAAVTFLTGLFDDLLTFLEGGESVIGKALNAMFGEGTATQVRDSLNGILDDIRKFFAEVTKDADTVKAVLKDIFSFGQTGALTKALKDSTGVDLSDQAFQKKAENAGAGVRDWTRNNLGNGVGDFLFGKNNEGSGQAGAALLQQSPAGLGAGNDVEIIKKVFTDMFSNFSAFPASTGVPFAPGGAGAPAGNQIKQDNKINITVAADTPKEITDAVAAGGTQALANDRRSALLALDQRAP